MNYNKTFSPVVRFALIRLILAIVASLDLELHQMDVKTAFLNEGLKEYDRGRFHETVMSNYFEMMDETT